MDMDNKTAEKLAKKINQVCRITGTFVLRSGITTNEYFDKYIFESSPELLSCITREMVSLIPHGTEILAGLELGGIPVVTLLSHYSGLPAVFVRKKPKEHGTAKLSEGIDVRDKKVLIVEDVVTTGGQIGLSATDLRNLGAHIESALCVIDREQGGGENLKIKANIQLHSLFKKSDLV